MIEVKGYPHLLRCPDTNAIISTDKAGIAEAKRKKQLRNKEREEKDLLMSRVDALESSLKDINTALQILINRD